MRVKLSHAFYTEYDYDFTLRTLIAVYQTCQVSGETIYDKNLVHLHHKLINSKQNRERFPYFIDSLFNLIPVMRSCQDAENRIKVSEEHAEMWNKEIEYISKRLFLGISFDPFSWGYYGKKAYGQIKDSLTLSLLNSEIERIRDYQRTRQSLHWNIIMTKKELEAIE